LKVAVFWNVTSSSLTVESEKFTASITRVMTEAVSTPETSANNPADYMMQHPRRQLNICRREELRPHQVLFYLLQTDFIKRCRFFCCNRNVKTIFTASVIAGLTRNCTELFSTCFPHIYEMEITLVYTRPFNSH
jgi:hypothetical protein